MNANMSRNLVVEAVFQATYLSGGAMMGRIVNTGTLVLGPYGLQYQPSPADRLVLRLGNQTHEFVVKDAQGNIGATTSAAWLLSPHKLHYVHRMQGEAEADISVYFDGNRFQADVKGWSMVRGIRYTAALSASGQSVSSRGYHGQEVSTQYQLKGTIQGDKFTVDVDEQHSLSLAAATNLRMPNSMRGRTGQFTGVLNNQLHVDGETYKFVNVKIVTGVKGRGGEGSAGIVEASGEVLRGGKPFGRCALQAGRVYLVTEGRQILLDLPAK
jgi:hypothetical protein